MNTVRGILFLKSICLADFKLQALKQIGMYTYCLIEASAHIEILIGQKDLNLIIMRKMKLN